MGNQNSAQKKGAKKGKKYKPSRNKEAEWVDENRSKLIQKVTLVMAIADEMLQQKILREEMYTNIDAARTPQDKMRELYKTLTSVKAKSAFYRILREYHPDLCEMEENKRKGFLWWRPSHAIEGPEQEQLHNVKKENKLNGGQEGEQRVSKKKEIQDMPISPTSEGGTSINFIMFGCGGQGRKLSL